MSDDLPNDGGDLPDSISANAASAQLSRIEAEMGRLRSVLYLLVKDKPDLLRLLGERPASGESHPA